MIIFDNDKFLKEVKKSGIGATDQYANKKIDMLLTDLIFNTTYTKDSIIRKVKAIAKDYYAGMPDDLVQSELQESYKRIRTTGKTEEPEKKTLTLYKPEMEIINALPKENLQRLAFASLIAFKWNAQHNVYGETRYYKVIAECMSDIYTLAHFEKVSGANRNKLQHELSKRGLVRYSLKTNPTYRYQGLDGKRWIAFTQFTVPFAVEVKGSQDAEIYMQVTCYDDVMLYLRYYQGDTKVTTCKCCGTPIEKTGSAKVYCSSCADKSKKQSDNARYRKMKKVI